MKKTFNYLFAILFVFSAISCQKENDEQQKPSDVEFSFDLGTQIKSALADSVVNAAAVVVSIEDLAGKAIYTSERIELYNMNGNYISKPISLVPGGYKLTKFFVIDAAGNILYVTPMEGSAKAHLVSDPLPILFSVIKNKVTKVVPQVISAKGSKPQDFGYATFSFDKVPTFDFLISVFVYNETAQNFEMTTAHLSIAEGSGWVYEKDVPAATDTISIKDNLSQYILTVTKDGYNTWVDTLTANELKLYYSNEDKGPLKIILLTTVNKAVTITTDQSNPGIVKFTIHNYRDDNHRNLTVDWGDNTISNYTIIPSKDNVTHTYNIAGIYNIKILGDVDYISLFTLYSNKITYIDVNACTDLGIFGFGSNLLTSIDLSKNKNLAYIDGYGNGLISIKLPQSPYLSDLSLAANKITSLDLQNFEYPELERLNIYGNNINSTIDLSKFPKLVEAWLQTNNISNIILSEKNTQLNLLTIFGNDLNSSTLDNVIINLLHSVKNNPRTGELDLPTEISPSSTGAIALDSLRQVYNWKIQYFDYNFGR
jgi:hypothetical protein